MDFTRILPELSKDAFKDVEILTDGQSRMITLSVPQSKLTYWMSAISGVENVEESDEKYEMKLVFDAQNNISKVYMRFQLFMDGVTLTVDLELSYSDIGANKPIELTSSEASYKELSISK